MRLFPLRYFAKYSSSGACRPLRRGLGALVAVAALILPGGRALAAPLAGAALVPLARMAAPANVPASAHALGHMDAGTPVTLAISLPLRNQAGLNDMLGRLYDPADPLYHHFLSQAEFTARFGPTQADYDAVTAYVKSQGLSVRRTYVSRVLLDVGGPSGAVEAAFHTVLGKYQMDDGRIAIANTVAPRLPQDIARRIGVVVGLNTTAPLPHPHRHALSGDALRARRQMFIQARPNLTMPIGTGPDGGLAPSDIKTAYSLTSVAPVNLSGLTGKGQAVALYELDGFVTDDIAQYANKFQLPTPNVTTILFNGFPGMAGMDAGEVTLDIDMILALAPNVHIYVYEAINDGSTDATSLYQRIADDGLAKSVSTSFGLDEAGATDNMAVTPENTAFQEMAAKGMSMFAAAGDGGAYDTRGAPTTLSVDDPASQPFVTGVGGTRLTQDKNTQSYISETTWNREPDPADGGGGGVSAIQDLPTYQSGIAGTASQSKRNVPDVSLNADPDTGYSVYQGGFDIVGGTSAAAPLWAAFTALVNEQRATFGVVDSIGFLNPTLYSLLTSGSYSSVFHDINDGSDNLFYKAGTGYDNATGLGTFIGDQLLATLSPSASAPVTITGTVINQSSNTSPTVHITIRAVQIPGLLRTPSAQSASGSQTMSFSQSLPSLILANQKTGATSKLTYNVSVDADGLAGETVNVTPANQTTVTLHLHDTPHTYGAGTLQMISAPYDYTSAGDFTQVFGLSLPLTQSQANLLSFSPTQNQYISYPAAPADTLHLGQGYWARLPMNSQLRRIGTPAATGQSFSINVQPGWNLIGDPFTQSVQVGSIQVAVPATTAAPNPGSTGIGQTGLVSLPLYTYVSAGANPYVQLNTGDSLQPYIGYWLFANQPATLIMPHP